ncbi:endo-1,4-beta xylanase [Pleurotus eryngii]|uniref:Beta-xylanase n=1 Tax=Pleurotus eryngii TaxID=5323 RepID=A0A9P6DBD4_PLEER|nr:endo-1,4-beta xylanase [Pleurotus eryngii]
MKPLFSLLLITLSRQVGAQLNRVAQAAGKLYFGTATNIEELSDTAYAAIINNRTEFGQITAANVMKWDSTEPSRGVFTFGAGDQIAALAKKNNQLLRGHNCVWHQQLPSWVTVGNFDAPTLSSIVSTHCSSLVGHYKGQIWDVINECLNDDGTFRQSVFFDTLNTSFIATALRAARAADPQAKLYINDFNIEGQGPKSTAMVNLVKSLQAQKVPIDGIGIQAHLLVGGVPSTLLANLKQFTALGVEVAITELDVRMTLPVTDALLAQQRRDYQTVISACRAVKGCIGVTVWDFSDKNMVRKPAIHGIIAGFA